MPDDNPRSWPLILTNEELAQQIEDSTPFKSDIQYLLIEAQRRQAIAFLRSHVDQEPPKDQ